LALRIIWNSPAAVPLSSPAASNPCGPERASS